MSEIQSFAILFSALIEIPQRISALEREQVQAKEKLDRLMTAMPPALATVPEAASAFKVSVPTMRRWVKRGDVPRVKIGNTMRVDLSRLHGVTSVEIAERASQNRAQLGLIPGVALAN